MLTDRYALPLAIASPTARDAYVLARRGGARAALFGTPAAQRTERTGKIV